MSSSRRVPTRRGDREGFSLIEVMFAMVFLGIGLLSMAQLIPLAGAQLTSSRNASLAMEAAETTLEQLKAEPFTSADLTAGTHYSTIDGKTVAYTITDNVPVNGTKRVDLSVSWDEATGTQTVQFTTHLSR